MVWVSCRFPATSRMFSSTGADGLSGTVLGALAGALVSGAPHAMAATSRADRVDVPSSDRIVVVGDGGRVGLALRIFWLPRLHKIDPMSNQRLQMPIPAPVT